MRGQQIVIESKKDVVELLAGLRAEVDQGSFFLVFSSKDFAGSLENDGSFDVRVIHRSQRGGGAFTPHLFGRIVPVVGGARIQGRLDYGATDAWMRWLLLLPIPLFATIVLVGNGNPWVVVWATLVSLFGTFGYPPLAYSICEADESQLCFLFERVAEAQREPMAAETG